MNWEGEKVPLSEEEQRILHEMEQKLYEHDPSFVDRVATRGRGSHAGRACRWAAVCFVAGFVLLLVSFRSSLVLATIGFTVMLFSALVFERKLRQLDGPVLSLLTRTFRGRGIAEELSDLRSRIRSHFKHQD